MMMMMMCRTPQQEYHLVLSQMSTTTIPFYHCFAVVVSVVADSCDRHLHVLISFDRSVQSLTHPSNLPPLHILPCVDIVHVVVVDVADAAVDRSFVSRTRLRSILVVIHFGRIIVVWPETNVSSFVWP